jgi:hypothetical protein
MDRKTMGESIPQRGMADPSGRNQGWERLGDVPSASIPTTFTDLLKMPVFSVQGLLLFFGSENFKAI